MPAPMTPDPLDNRDTQPVPPGSARLPGESAPHPTPSPTASLREGSLIAERFRILRLIGRGGMGEVYEAEDARLRAELRQAITDSRPSQALMGTYLTEKLRPAISRRVEQGVLAASFVVFAAIAYLGALYTWDEYRFEVLSPGLGVPQWQYTVWMPLLSALICLRILGRMLRVAKAGR